MKKRICVFVDGENFRHAICDLFSDFNREDYLPQKAKWQDLFDYLTNFASKNNGERIRTYWYVIGNIDFYPHKLPNLSLESKDIDVFKRQISKFRDTLLKSKKHKEEIEKLLSETEQIERIKEITRGIYKDKDKTRSRYEGWGQIQRNISRYNDAIEFRNDGTIRYDLLEHKFKTEKAVDVQLATDMIVLKDIYDIAIIVSGDQDFVPAVKQLKNYGKRVINIAFAKRSGGLLPGGAIRLNEVTDDRLIIDHNTLSQYLDIDDAT